MKKVDARKLFVSSIKELMAKKPLHEIKTTEIINLSGLTRQCFYSYYRDKYDLVNQIFDAEANVCRHIYLPDGSIMKDHITDMLEIMQANHLFYTNAFKYQEQNSLFSYMNIEGFTIHKNILIPKAHSKQSENEIYMLKCIKFHSLCVTSVISDWATRDMPDSPQQMSKLIMETMPSVMKEYYHYRDH